MTLRLLVLGDAWCDECSQFCIVFLVDVVSNDAFFLFYRSKKDKIGKNITIQNQDFKKILYSYLSLLDTDLEIGNIDVYKI